MKHRHSGHRQGRQTGFVLITGLLLLIVMSVVGVSMMNVTRLQTLMAGGAREANIAFQAAEAALRDAESTILNPATELCTLAIAPTTSGSGQYGQLATEPAYTTHNWTSGSDYTIYTPNDYPELPTTPTNLQPRYLIKDLGDTCVLKGTPEREPCLGVCGADPNCELVRDFRVTAWGTSRDASSVKLLQTRVSCFP
jgi:type IV pilus assembly protein PilX